MTPLDRQCLWLLTVLAAASALLHKLARLIEDNLADTG